MRIRIVMVVFAFFGIFLGSSGVTDEKVLKTLKKEHPRLLVNRETWTQLKTRRKSDPLLSIAQYRAILDNYGYHERSGRESGSLFCRRGSVMGFISPTLNCT